jgi:hypothetical protein
MIRDCGWLWALPQRHSTRAGNRGADRGADCRDPRTYWKFSISMRSLESRIVGPIAFAIYRCCEVSPRGSSCGLKSAESSRRYSSLIDELAIRIKASLRPSGENAGLASPNPLRGGRRQLPPFAGFEREQRETRTGLEPDALHKLAQFPFRTSQRRDNDDFGLPLWVAAQKCNPASVRRPRRAQIVGRTRTHAHEPFRSHRFDERLNPAWPGPSQLKTT